MDTVPSATAPSLGAFQFVATSDYPPPTQREIKKIWHCSLLSLSL